MNLNNDDMEKVKKWIYEKNNNLKCFACGNSIWDIQNISTIPIGYDVHSTRFHYHNGIPQISIICRNCGYIMHYSANIMGFKPDIPEQVIVEEDKNSKSTE